MNTGSKRLLVLITAGLVLALSAAAVDKTPGAQARTTGLNSSSLAIDSAVRMEFDLEGCPPNAPPNFCYRSKPARSVVRGLGEAVWNLELDIDRSDPAQQCSSWTLLSGSVTGAGKGAFTLTGASEGCQPFNRAGKVAVTVSGGDGRFAGASGSGLLDFVEQAPYVAGVRLTGTLTVPGFEFDLTAPTISGAQNKGITTRRRVRAVRVRYVVTAQDDVDGSIPAKCMPRSGSRFRIGRTRVTCTAQDSSANVAAARFIVAVKRKAFRR
jgi:hypothetical protein